MLIPTIVLGLLSHGVGFVSAASKMPGQRLLLDNTSTVGLPLAATASASRSATPTPSAQNSASVGLTSSAFASASISAVAHSSSSALSSSTRQPRSRGSRTDLSLIQESYAFGSGTSLNDYHYVANELSGAYSGCNGVYQVVEDTPAAGFPDAQITLNCNGQSGNSVDASFTFSVNGQVLQCTFINHNDGSNAFFIICGSSAGVANTCAASAMAAVAGMYPAAYLSTPSWTFLPN
ncbi:hypothetical protein FB45DRAFT_1109055 [Roridomyces roridus]|uniref:AA1-like domain-containing protein n=1 Tax=Roridomyces roridus TaxID=1738132 RepID=A0AAD7B9M2_9AGAR|nr:hypothetical protein FB45DRAFT_1109055 [Roridomyces roridus]